MKRPTLFAFFLVITVMASPVTAAELDVSKLAGMKARLIGPAGMSGRVSAVTVDPSNPSTIYVGAAAGGVWKSINGGISWRPLFDSQPVASVGAVAVDPTNPDVIWVGTGEGNPRNSVSVGNGIYRSDDGGMTWRHLGLEGTRHIYRVLINPHHPNIVYVAALGWIWGENEERGVFRTRDGGQTWEKVLFVNSMTGAADLVMDPRNPDKLIAAMWQFQRRPWFLTSGGEGSGIYITFDGGNSWNRRTDEAGIPKSPLGRIGLAIAANRPEVVYALVEAERSALIRSDDGGLNWTTVNSSRNINPRPFYYADIRVDPRNENRIYRLHSSLDRSEDGGKTFRGVVNSARIHGDYHALWIDPQNSAHMISGNDGGIAITRDLGENWQFIDNLPLAQFYHVAVDNEIPYNVYGGLQDNGSWRGPSQVWATKGIFNFYWDRVGSGDGFDVQPDPIEPARYGYSMSQGGELRRFDLLTGERHVIRPVHPEGDELRFNWNAALAVDPFEPSHIYYGSQYVHLSRNRGNSWETISPDLTTDNPEKQLSNESGGLTYDATGAENHTTIVSIAPSPAQRGVIWVGTDDGNIQVTRDAGHSWSNRAGSLPDSPAGAWIPHIEPSPHSGAAAFAVLDNHRNNDLQTYIYSTLDFGETWARLSTEGIRGYALCIEQDPVEPRLLFAGTEFGLFLSLDGGGSWIHWTSGVPTTSVMDLAIHPRDHDLVIATHGRAVFVLDDIRPLRALAQEGAQLLDKSLHVFETPETYQHSVAEPKGLRGPGEAMFQGENRRYGTLITYVYNNFSNGSSGHEIAIEILDASGEVIRSFTNKSRPGLNRTAWDLRRKGVTLRPQPSDDAEDPPGFWALPGTYQARLSAGQQSVTTTFRVLPDPRNAVTPEVFQAKDQLVQQVEKLVDGARNIRETLAKAQEVIDFARKQKAASEPDLRQQIDQVASEVRRLREMADGPTVQGIKVDPTLVSSKVREAYSSVGQYWALPTPEQGFLADQAERALSSYRNEVLRFFEGPWKSLCDQADQLGFKLFPERLADGLTGSR